MIKVTVIEEMYRALRLVQVLQDKPDCNPPGHGVHLDPMAKKQVDQAIVRCESEHTELKTRYVATADEVLTDPLLKAKGT